jgi:hypothetical protein
VFKGQGASVFGVEGGSPEPSHLQIDPSLVQPAELEDQSISGAGSTLR